MPTILKRTLYKKSSADRQKRLQIKKALKSRQSFFYFVQLFNRHCLMAKQIESHNQQQADYKNNPEIHGNENHDCHTASEYKQHQSAKLLHTPISPTLPTQAQSARRQHRHTPLIAIICSSSSNLYPRFCLFYSIFNFLIRNCNLTFFSCGKFIHQVRYHINEL